MAISILSNDLNPSIIFTIHRYTEPLKRGFLPLEQSPINTQLATEISPKIGDEIIRQESFKNPKQKVDKLPTHAFLSHKRTSAQGVAGIAIYK